MTCFFLLIPDDDVLTTNYPARAMLRRDLCFLLLDSGLFSNSHRKYDAKGGALMSSQLTEQSEVSCLSELIPLTQG